jgi:hypothetical protein
MALARLEIQFNARDGTTLRGWFYPQDNKSPCVIMTHGVGVSAALSITGEEQLLKTFKYH